MAAQKKAAGKAASSGKSTASGKKSTAAKKSTTAKGSAASKSTAKKSTTKKTPAAKSGSRKSAPKNPIVKEIISLMDGMSDDALAMLKRQAEVLSYAQELEAARSKMKEAVDRSLDERAAARKAEATKKAAAGSKGAGGKEEPYVDQSGPSSFFIGARGKRVFFSRDEMRNLTRLSHGAKDALAGARRIFGWLERERQDFLIDTGINQPGDKSLQRLWEIIVTSYKASS